MRSVSAIIVVLAVVAAAPIGVAAASGAPAAAASGLAQFQDGGLTAQTTATESNETTDTSTATAEPTAGAETSTATPDSTGDANETAANDSDAPSSLAPGAQLAAVVGVQRTEIGSEVESRAFGQRVAAANSDASRATIVAGSLDDSRERLTELRDRLAELERDRENGTISEARYKARTAQLSARINAVEHHLEQANETASGLPERVREEHGVNVSNIERLREEARNLSGPEVAAIAREVAGENPGRGMGGPPEDVVAPGRSGDAPGRSDVGNGTETDAGPGNGQGPPASDGESASAAGNGAPGGPGNAADNSGNGRQSGTPGNEGASSSGPDNDRRGGPGGPDDGDGTPGRSDDAPGQSGDAPGRSGGDPGNGGANASAPSSVTDLFDFLDYPDIRI